MARPADSDIVGSRAAGPAAVRGGTLRLVGYGAGVLLTVGSAAVLFRHLGRDDTGRYVLVLALVTLFGGITDAGLSTLGVREMSVVGGIDRGLLLRNLLGLRIVLTSTGVGLACVYATLAGYAPSLIAGTAIAGAGLLLANTQNALATVLLADLRLGWVTIAEGLRQAVTAVGIVVLALLGASLLPFFAVTVLAGATVLLLTARLVRGTPRRPGFDLAVWRALLRDAAPFALAAAVGAVYFRLAIVLVGALADDRQLGYFGASFRIVEVLVLVPQIAIGAAFPIFARAASDDRERLRYALQKTLDASLLAGSLLALSLGLGAPFVIDVVAGPGFGGAIPVLRLHAVALAASFAGAVFGYALLSLRQHRAVLVMNIAALAAVAAAAGVLIPLAGAQGAAVATIVSESVLGGLGAWFVARSGAVGVISMRSVPRLALAVAIGVAVPTLLGLPSLPAAVLGTVLCIGTALATGAVPAEMLDELRAVAARLRASRAAGRRT